MSNRVFKLLNAKQWPKEYDCEFIGPGLVNYKDLKAGICRLDKEVIDKMLPSFIGKPVTIDHVKVTPENVNKVSVGYVTGTYYNSQTGKYHAKFIVTEDEGHEKIAQGYSVSCAYNTSSLGGRGKLHAIPYDQEILGGDFTHLAIVKADTARYEDSYIDMVDSGLRVFQNSLGEARLLKDKPKQEGKSMKLKFSWPISIENSRDKLDAQKTNVDINGKSVPLQKLIEAYNSKETGKIHTEDITEDSTIEILNSNGEPVQVAVKDLVAAFNASDEDEAKKKKDEEDEKKEIENSMDEKEKKEYDAMDEEKKCSYRNSKKEMKNAKAKEEKEAADQLVLENARKVKEAEDARLEAQKNVKTFVAVNSRKEKVEIPASTASTSHDGSRASGLKVAQGYFGKGKFAKKA